MPTTNAIGKPSHGLSPQSSTVQIAPTKPPTMKNAQCPNESKPV